MKTKENRPFVPYKQRVGGSNPSTPTTENQAVKKKFLAAFYFIKNLSIGPLHKRLRSIKP